MNHPDNPGPSPIPSGSLNYLPGPPDVYVVYRLFTLRFRDKKVLLFRNIYSNAPVAWFACYMPFRNVGMMTPDGQREKGICELAADNVGEHTGIAVKSEDVLHIEMDGDFMHQPWGAPPLDHEDPAPIFTVFHIPADTSVGAEVTQVWGREFTWLSKDEIVELDATAFEPTALRRWLLKGFEV